MQLREHQIVSTVSFLNHFRLLVLFCSVFFFFFLVTVVVVFLLDKKSYLSIFTRFGKYL